MAFPPNRFGPAEVAGGSLTRTSRTFPRTSVLLKSSHLYSGAVAPYPTKTSSPRAELASVAEPGQTTTSSVKRRLALALPEAVTLMLAGSALTTSIGTRWKYELSPTPGFTPNAWSWVAMYSSAICPPRVAGARPSRRSEDRKRRCASISWGVMRLRSLSVCASAMEAEMTETSATESRTVGRVIDLLGVCDVRQYIIAS